MSPWSRKVFSRRTQVATKRRPFLQLELLEARTMLSGNSLTDSFAHPNSFVIPNVPGMTPSQMRHAYGFDLITFNGGTIQGDGTGQTIAIVDAFNNPAIVSDLATFDSFFGLPAPPTFRVTNQTGGTSLPPNNTGWGLEEALDVEWAHAIAPGASILLVEATDNSWANLLAAEDYARGQPGVMAVSNSWSGGESSTELTYDSHFVTPTGHNGVTFLASTGDSGAPGGYPAFSPNVMAVGGTTLNIDSSGNYLSESGWSGSGGGRSSVEAKPSYQTVFPFIHKRMIPDIALDANPATGAAVFDSFGAGGWVQVGGTSLSAPAWAGYLAIVDQGRTLAGKDTLANGQAAMYSLPASDFHDITTGNNGFKARVGYDLVTGLGSPRGNLMVNDLVNAPSNHVLTPEGPRTGAGTSLVQAAVRISAESNASFVPSTVVTTVTPATVTVRPGADRLVATVAESVHLGAAGNSVTAAPARVMGIVEIHSADNILENAPDAAAIPVGMTVAVFAGLADPSPALVGDEALTDDFVLTESSSGYCGDQMPTPVAENNDAGNFQLEPSMLAGLAVVLAGVGNFSKTNEERRTLPRIRRL